MSFGNGKANLANCRLARERRTRVLIQMCCSVQGFCPIMTENNLRAVRLLGSYFTPQMFFVLTPCKIIMSRRERSRKRGEQVKSQQDFLIQTKAGRHPWSWHRCGELIWLRAVIQTQGEPCDILSWLGISPALAFCVVSTTLTLHYAVSLSCSHI